jgi:serine/threonine-protein kinase HipA
VKALAVYFNGDQVGVLQEDEGGHLTFHYLEAWIIRPHAVPLSRMLPLKSGPFSDRVARPFFSGILPEEESRRRITSYLGISDDNDFSLLEQLGGECAGAVSLLPMEEQPVVRSGGMRELSDEELKDVVELLPTRPFLVGEEGLRLSLAGAQSKLPVIVKDGRIALPLGDSPSTHILKPEPERFPGLAANEVFCMRLAKSMGLQVPSVENRVIAGHPCILVERYDRKIDANGNLQRLHQEDFCQALGLPPHRKYQVEGGPGLKDCIELLREWSTVPVLDLREFIDGFVFCTLVGNADAHGKNFALVYDRGERRLAPFYDLVCTVAWPNLTKNLSMKVGGCKVLPALSSGHWKNACEPLKISWPLLRDRMLEICQLGKGASDEALASMEEPGLAMVNQVRDGFLLRIERLENDLKHA